MYLKCFFSNNLRLFLGSQPMLVLSPGRLAFVILLVLKSVNLAPVEADDIGPKSKKNVAHLESAREKLSQKDFTVAEQRYKDAIRASPQSLDARFELADLLIRLGRHSEGLAHLEYAAFKLHPNDAKIRYRYAKALEKSLLPKEAIEQLEKTIDLDPAQLLGRGDLIRLLLSQNAIMQASSASSEGVRLRPNDSDVQNDHGAVLMRAGKVAAAEEAFRRAIKLNPEHVDAHYNIGILQLGRWQLDAAEKHLETALKLTPNYADAHYVLGQVFARQGKTEHAVEQLNTAAKLKPEAHLIQYELGKLHMRLGHSRQAVAALTEALRDNPGHWPSQYELGVLLLELKKPKLAIPQFEAVVLQQPTNADVHYQFGQALGQLDQGKQALAHFREALWQRPGWELAERAIAEIEGHK